MAHAIALALLLLLLLDQVLLEVPVLSKVCRNRVHSRASGLDTV